jgi:hypothetical protein
MNGRLIIQAATWREDEYRRVNPDFIEKQICLIAGLSND